MTLTAVRRLSSIELTFSQEQGECHKQTVNQPRVIHFAYNTAHAISNPKTAHELA